MSHGTLFARIQINVITGLEREEGGLAKVRRSNAVDGREMNLEQRDV